jgi:hypothetical protein
MGGYARNFGMFSIGGSLKLYSQTIPNNEGFGVTGDVGALIEMPWMEGFRAGSGCAQRGGTAKYGRVAILTSSIRYMSSALL